MAVESNHNPILLPMKKPDLTPLLLSATLFLAFGAAVSAQEAPPPAPEAPAADAVIPPPPRAEMIKKFDKNGDGQLDDAEKAEARKAFVKKHPGLAKHMKQAKEKRGPGAGPEDKDFRRGWLLGKFDANNDGKLDETERAAARADGEKRLRAGAEKRLQHLKSLDTDGDGKFNDTEWAAAKAEFQKQHPERAGRDGPPHDGPPHDGPPPPDDGLGHKE
jgi:hypothetical protein